MLYIMHPRGHTLEVQLQGATITRWLKPDGEDLLHVRSDAVREPGQPINSGIPLAFPQWRDGQLPFNGFADKLEWSVVGTAFDGEFVNMDVPDQAWQSGAVELAVDEDGNALVPRPQGMLDWDDDVRGANDPEDDAQFDADIESYLDQPEQQPPPTTKTPKARGRQAAAMKAKAAEEAAAAEAANAAAAAAQQEADAAAAVAAAQAAAADASLGSVSSDSSADEEDGEDNELEGVDYGILEDVAPYVILQLSDTEETRAIWPHKFDLYYKITLMEEDDFPDPKEGLPRGVFQYAGSDTPVGPEYAALRELMEGDDEEVAAAAAAELAERYRASNIRAGVGLDSVFSETEAETVHPLPGRRTSSGLRLFTDEDGQMNDEEALAEAADAAAAVASAKPLRGAAAASAKAKAAAARAKAAVDAADAEAAADAAAGEDPDALPTGMHNPVEPPMQIKLEWVLVNNDPEGSAPMSFQLGALPHFATEDQSKHGEFVRVLGLGGSLGFDWSADTRRPRLVGNNNDYLMFAGDRHDAVWTNTTDADIKFCPGSRTHFEFFQREGVPDTVVWHPGGLGVPGLEVEPRFFAQIGAGRLARPKTLAPGEQWKGEYVVRYHEQYWEPPIFDRDAAQPMPKLVTQRDDADDREDIDDEWLVEGVTSSRLGGGPHVPLNDE